MARIFFVLALFALVLLLVNLAVGFAIGDLNQGVHDWLEAKREFRNLSRSSTKSNEQLKAAQDKLNSIRTKLQPILRRNVLHTLLGVGGALVTVLVNSISVTYFIGTSRWCREVVEAYRLPEELAQRSAQLKRKTFPWSLIGILTIVVIVGFGAACDPTIHITGGAKHYVTPHMIAALVGTAVIAWAFLAQVVNVGANYEVIEQILKLVEDAIGEKIPQPNTPKPDSPPLP